MTVTWVAIIITALAVLLDAYMYIRINRRLSLENKIPWLGQWRHPFNVSRRYQELFPGSILPLICRCAFWLSLVAVILSVFLPSVIT